MVLACSQCDTSTYAQILESLCEVLSTQLDSVSTQATLIIGFSLGLWAGETLVPLTDDTSPHCIYKSLPSQLLGAAFFLVVALGASFCWSSGA